MDIGMVGLGRMGANMALRLQQGGHRVVVYDVSPIAVAVATGSEGAESLAALVAALAPPRRVWLMVPAQVVEDTLTSLAGLLSAGDVVADGGNSFYKDSLRRAETLRKIGVQFVDAGTSGGIWGLEEGYCLMLGGDEAAVEALRPALETLAPAANKGWARVGPSGAGHFAKMVHNGIEYGLMQAYAEGFGLLKAKTEFEFDLPALAELWRSGSVVRSWLLDLAAKALAENPGLEGIAPRVDDSGEGRWTVTEAVDLGLPLPVITLALQNRFRSRQDDVFADKLLAALRHEFGGHPLTRKD